MSFRGAPTVRRNPISWIRSDPDISMRFLITMPPPPWRCRKWQSAAWSACKKLSFSGCHYQADESLAGFNGLAADGS